MRAVISPAAARPFASRIFNAPGSKFRMNRFRHVGGNPTVLTLIAGMFDTRRCGSRGRSRAIDPLRRLELVACFRMLANAPHGEATDNPQK